MNSLYQRMIKTPASHRSFSITEKVLEKTVSKQQDEKTVLFQGIPRKEKAHCQIKGKLIFSNL